MTDQDRIYELEKLVHTQSKIIKHLNHLITIKDKNLWVEGEINKEFMNAIYEGRVEVKNSERIERIRSEALDKKIASSRVYRKSALRSSMYEYIIDVLSENPQGLFLEELHKKSMEKSGHPCSYNTFRGSVYDLRKNNKINMYLIKKGYAAVYTLIRPVEIKEGE